MKKYSIGITSGVFDLFHVGHLNLLEKCKEYCDKLVVAVCDDNYVIEQKNKYPTICQADRARILNALKCVDDVIIVNFTEVDDKYLLWQKYNFDVLFSGDDWKGSERYKKTEEQFKHIGVDIVYLPYTQGVSTSDIQKKLNEN